MKLLTIQDPEYKKWVLSLCTRYRRSQIKAAVKVNEEMLRFYWNLGKDISEREEENKYGSAFFATLSQDLKREMPDVQGLSASNIRYAQRFYLLYQDALSNLQQVVEDLGKTNFQQVAENLEYIGNQTNISNTNPPQIVADLENYIFKVPWGHQLVLIDKFSEEPEKAIFYIRETVRNGWSRDVLRNFIDTDLYSRQGKALTNFSRTLPEVTSDLAKELTKDPYNFAFTGLTERYNERILKNALLNNITQFLIELGTGFAYVGKEYRLKIGETEKFIDLLFYNLNISAYVVVEVKIGTLDFKDTGQLGGYVVACNHILRREGRDNPTIGLLICRDKNNLIAQYALEASNLPLGISEYELSKIYPEKLEGTIPTIDELEKGLENMENKVGHD